jgi:hypothetical protein
MLCVQTVIVLCAQALTQQHLVLHWSRTSAASIAGSAYMLALQTATLLVNTITLYVNTVTLFKPAAFD